MELSSGVKALKKRMEIFYRPESYRTGLSMKARSDDVIVATSQKAGTSWITQILHTLRSKGDLNYDELFLEVPLLEGAIEYGYGDIDKPQRFNPRMFFTHMGFPHVPKGAGKYVFSMRDPHDTGVSLYYYLCGWLFAPEEVSVDDFVEFYWLARGDNSSGVSWPSQFHHVGTPGSTHEDEFRQDFTEHMLQKINGLLGIVTPPFPPDRWASTEVPLCVLSASWYEHRHDENVLWLHYEDLKEDLPRVIKKIAQFVGIGTDDKELLELVKKHASMDFMKEHHSKFDSHMIKKTRNIVLDLPEDAGLIGHCGRVREGKSGGGKQELSPRLIELVNEHWRKIVEPVTGCKSYAELRDKITKELEAREQAS